MSDTALQAAPATLMNGEQLFGFTAIAKRLPGYRDNTHVNSSTVFRWATKGVRAANGELIRLEAVRLGMAWKTSLEAAARFAAKLTEASLPSECLSPEEPTPAPAARKRAANKASAELDAILGLDKQ